MSDDLLDCRHQLRLEARRFPAAHVAAQMLVSPNDDVAEVERVLELLLGDDDCGARPHAVPDAELVGGIEIRRREVGDHEIGAEQRVVHRAVDRA